MNKLAEFYTVVTDAGREAVARATQAGEKVDITHFAVGDGGGSAVTPDESQTQLVNECWRGLVATYSQQGDSLIIDTYIPADEESFTVREMGIFTADGVLFAVCNTPEMRKVLPSEGAVGNFTLGMELDITNIDMNYIEIHTNPELDFIKNSEKGQPNGVPILDEHGKIPADNMPANTPTLGEDGKIPIGQLPTLDFIPNSQKGIAGGVAPLGLDGFLSLAFGGIGAGTATGARTNLEVAKPVRTEVLFPTSGWILSGNTYTQTIACSVAKATMKYANIGAKYSTDAAARELEKEAYALIAYIDTLDGQLKATCWGNEKPQVNLTLIFEGGVN